MYYNIIQNLILNYNMNPFKIVALGTEMNQADSAMWTVLIIAYMHVIQNNLQTAQL